MLIKRGNIVLVGLVLFFSLPSSFGLIGVSPPSYNIPFTSEEKYVFGFSFSNDADMGLNISLTGDLAEYAELSTTYCMGSCGVSVLLKLPEYIERPGIHGLGVVAKQEASVESGAAVGLVGVVIALVRVMVPFSGPYPDLSFIVPNVNAGEDVSYTLRLSNIGNGTLESSTSINIYDSRNSKIKNIELGEDVIGSLESKSYTSTFSSLEYSGGTYRADAVVKYLDKEINLSRDFRLGELRVKVTNYTKYIERGKFNKFDIYVESQWNDPLENVYAEVFFPDQYSNLNFRTPSAKIGSFGTAILSNYFDASPIIEDKFSVKVKLYYQNQTSEEQLVVKFRSEVNYIVIGLVILGALIILIIAIIAFIKIKRRFS